MEEVFRVFIQEAIGVENKSLIDFVIKESKKYDPEKGLYVEWNFSNKIGSIEIKEGKLTISK
jgi:hypothetical protein